MSLITERWRLAANIVIAVMLATGIWYVVVGSEQVDAQFDLRLDYRGLPEGMVVRDGMISRVTVRLRGSAELLRGLYNRDLTYTVDLGGIQRGANVLPLDLERMPEFRAYEVLESMPPRLMLEVDALIEKLLPLEPDLVPLPDDSPLRLFSPNLDPAFASVRGPETLINPLQSLPVRVDPSRDPTPGGKAINVAIVAPEQVNVTPPVTTLRYTLELKTQEVSMQRVVQLDAADHSQLGVDPGRVSLKVEVPEARVEDSAYLAAIRVVVRPSDRLREGAFEDAPVLVMLPEGARLSGLEPSVVRIRRALPTSSDAARE